MITILPFSESGFAIPNTSSFWRISVDRYHQMIQKGLLTTDDRLELLDGFLIEKSSVSPQHSFVTTTIC